MEAAASTGEGFNRLHAYSYGIAKAGMTNVDQQKVE